MTAEEYIAKAINKSDISRRNRKMFDIEEMILERQESLADDCHSCPYKGRCNNQCMETEEHYNPNLR